MHEKPLLKIKFYCLRNARLNLNVEQCKRQNPASPAYILTRSLRIASAHDQPHQSCLLSHICCQSRSIQGSWCVALTHLESAVLTSPCHVDNSRTGCKPPDCHIRRRVFLGRRAHLLEALPARKRQRHLAHFCWLHRGQSGFDEPRLQVCLLRRYGPC